MENYSFQKTNFYVRKEKTITNQIKKQNFYASFYLFFPVFFILFVDYLDLYENYIMTLFRVLSATVKA